MNDFEKELGKFKLVLGLEIHLHVNTSMKMFCGCSADIYGKEPNTHTCPVCLGLPGALPVPNFEAIRKTQILGLALNCKLNKNSRFDRKHYFYPDLPKGYQISQYKIPFCEDGFVELDSGMKAAIERIHLEEDTAKSSHVQDETLIDFNMSGMPLVEIVTKPVFTNTADAVNFSKKIQDLVRYLELGDVDMEKGQMRLEANISLRTAEMENAQQLPDYKVEIKNINSFRFMEKAVLAEITRQRAMLEKGEKIKQENRGWNEDLKTTVSQRDKEEAHDYRYFPEPDIPPIEFTDEYILELQNEIPELPSHIKKRLIENYKLKESSATEFSNGDGLKLLKEFESHCAENLDPNTVANLLLNKKEFRNLNSTEFAAKLNEISQTLDSKDELLEIVKLVLSENSNAVEDYRNGKESAIQFLLGQVKRKTQGKANPEITLQLIIENI